jgi:hypothetical protein
LKEGNYSASPLRGDIFGDPCHSAQTGTSMQAGVAF